MRSPATRRTLSAAPFPSWEPGGRPVRPVRRERKGRKALRVRRARPVRLERRARLGAAGAAGAIGAQGPAGTVLSFADFYALMPPNNSATVAPGTAVSFPIAGAASGTDIVQSNATTFTLAAAGIYLVTFQVSVTEPGQFVVAQNGFELPQSVVGRATGTSQIVGTSMVSASAGDSLQVNNPAGGSSALTITPLAGGTHAVSAHLTTLRLR